MCLYCKPLIKAIDNYIAKADDSLSDTLDDEGFAKPKKSFQYIKDIEDSAAEALIAETEYFVAEAEKAVDLETFAKDVWPGLKIGDTLKPVIASIFTEQLEKFMPEFVGYYITQTDKNLKLEQVSKRTTAWVKSWSEELGEIMQLNSHKEIERIMEKGIKDGKGIAEFAKEILDSGIRDEYYKARRVAVTEVLRAHSVAQQEAFMQSPAVDMNGQCVPVDEPFDLVGADGSGYSPMYPRDTTLPPEESINCHCICQPVVNEEILGLSLEERQQLQQQIVDEMDDEWEKELDAANRAKAGIDLD